MATAVVCGAGPAGLASAACLQRAGIDTLVLERGESIGTSWRRRYPALRLNTLGWMSTLPGYRATRRGYGEFPTRDDWVRYLEDYAAHHRIEPRFGVEARRVDRSDGGWRVETSDGPLDGDFAVLATGFDHDPYVPEWPGRDSFEGELVHAAEYRDPEPFRGQDVLIVGPGNTGSEIAAFLADGGAARVRAATRTPPNIFPRKWLGVPVNLTGLSLDYLPGRTADAIGRATQRMIYGDLSKYGLAFPPLGVKRSIEQRFVSPAIDAGFVKAVKERRIEIVPTVERFEGRDVVLVDGSRIRPDVVICATGYRRGLEPLVGHLGVLDERGMQRTWPKIEVPEAPGLFFLGYYARVSGQLRQMRLQARQLARTVRRRAAAEARPAAPRAEATA
jgi:putative flavoprotein involved in K+ transport